MTLRASVLSLILLAGICSTLGPAIASYAQVQGSAPEITFIDFPSIFEADGVARVGRIYFEDPDGDVIQAGFTVLQATAFEGFGLDVEDKIQSSGVFKFFEFEISTTITQRVELEVVLVDAQSLRSNPSRFTFEAVGDASVPVVATLETTVTSRLQVDPPRLSFQSTADGNNPTPQTLNITGIGNGALFWSADANAPWIRLSRNDGSTPASVTVLVDVSGLAVGIHLAQITISSEGMENDPIIIPVILTLDTSQVEMPVVELETDSDARLAIFVFQSIEFSQPERWQSGLQNGCFIHTNIDVEPNIVRVIPPDHVEKAFSIPPGKQIIVCGNTVLIDTRP